MTEIRDEWKKITSGKFIILMLIVPIIFAVLFSYIFQNGMAQEVPLAVVDMDHSAYSRQLIEKLDASQYTKVSDTYDNYVDADLLLYNERYSGVLYLPAGLETAYTQGKTITLGFYVDKTLSTSAGWLVTGVNEVISTENAAKGASVVLSSELRNLYNPTSTFLMTTVMMLINVVILVLISLNTMPIAPRLRESGQLSEALKNPIRIMLRSVPYALVGTVSLYLAIGAYKQFAHVRFEANLFEIFVPFFLFCFSSGLMAMAIGWTASSSKSAAGRIVFMALPATLLGGASFPYLMMPPLMQCINQLMPFAMQFRFLRGMGYKGGRLRYFIPELGHYCLIIAFFAVVIILLSFHEAKKEKAKDKVVELNI